MDFIIQNQNLLISIGVLIGIILIGLIITPYLKNKKFIKQEDIDNTAKILEITNTVLNAVQFDKKDQIKSVFTIVENVFKYMSDDMKANSDIEKEKLIYDTTIKTLKQLDIEVTKEIQEIIELAINTVLGSNQ